MLFRLLTATLIAFLLAPALAAAQTTEPVGTVATGDDEVARAFDNPDVLFDALAGIMAFGSIYDDPTAASRSLRTFPAVFTASLSVEPDDPGGIPIEFGELEEVEIPALGEEATAHRLPLVLSGFFEGEYAMVGVRKAEWVQILIGYGIGEVDVVAELHAIAGTLLPRWPDPGPIAVREDGLRTGGLWMTVPAPEDLPAGFALDAAFEEGPGPTTDEIVPVGPAAAPTEPPATGRDGSRELPLLPTVTPAAQPTEPSLVLPPLDATQPADPAPAAPPATEAPATGPAEVTVHLLLPLASAAVAPDDTCQGSGLLAAVAPGATLSLRDPATGTTEATATIDAATAVGPDPATGQQACHLAATFAGVPPRDAWVLLAGETVLGYLTAADTAASPLMVSLLPE